MATDDFDSSGFLDRLEKVESNLITKRAQAASASRHLEQLDLSMQDQSLQMQRDYEGLVAADLPAAITQMVASETSLQASLQVAARGSNLSLVNFLR